MKYLIITTITILMLSCSGYSQEDYVRFSKEFCEELSSKRHLGYLLVIRSNTHSEKLGVHYIVDIKYLYFDYLRFFELQYSEFTEFLFNILNKGYDRTMCGEHGENCEAIIDYLCIEPIPLGRTPWIDYAKEYQLEKIEQYNLYKSKEYIKNDELKCLVKTMFFNQYFVLFDDENNRYNFAKFND